jgi:hypothetical protein
MRHDSEWHSEDQRSQAATLGHDLCLARGRPLVALVATSPTTAGI